MNKTRLRLISLFLIPALVADPAATLTEACQRSPARARSASAFSVIQEQALVSRARWVHSLRRWFNPRGQHDILTDTRPPTPTPTPEPATMPVEVESSPASRIRSENYFSVVHIPELQDYPLTVLDGMLSPDDPSTRLFRNFIVRKPGRVRDKRVLDAGSGTGILTLLLAAAGARQVVAADVDPVAVQNTQMNVRGSASDIEERVLVGHSDGYDDLDKITGESKPKYDVVVGNYPVFAGEPVSNQPITTATRAGHDFRFNRRAIQGLPAILNVGGSGYFYVVIGSRWEPAGYWGFLELEQALPPGWTKEPIDGDFQRPWFGNKLVLVRIYEIVSPDVRIARAMQGDPFFPTLAEWVKAGEGTAHVQANNDNHFELRYEEKTVYGIQRHRLTIYHEGRSIGYAHFRIQKGIAVMYSSFDFPGIAAISLKKEYLRLKIGQSLIGLALRLAYLNGARDFQVRGINIWDAVVIGFYRSQRFKLTYGLFGDVFHFPLDRIASWTDFPTIALKLQRSHSAGDSHASGSAGRGPLHKRPGARGRHLSDEGDDPIEVAFPTLESETQEAVMHDIFRRHTPLDSEARHWPGHKWLQKAS